MAQELTGKRVAMLVTDGFEQIEMTDPREALVEAGAKVDLIAPRPEPVQGWHHMDKADRFPVDAALSEADPMAYDGLVLPGGVVNADHLRLDERAVAFARSIFEAGKPIAAICHGGWLLVEAGLVSGKRVTSYPSLRTDMENAGAEWTDEEVVVDGGLVTSRRPPDLPAFNRETILAIAEGRAATEAA